MCFNSHFYLFWLGWLASRVILWGKDGKISLRSWVCDFRWYLHSHFLSAVCGTEKQISCNSRPGVIILLTVMGFVKDISLAIFANKWSLFPWFVIGEVERAMSLRVTLTAYPGGLSCLHVLQQLTGRQDCSSLHPLCKSQKSFLAKPDTLSFPWRSSAASLWWLFNNKSFLML